MSSTTIDSLAIQIQDNSKTVTKGLDNLATSLQKLRQATQGLNLSGVSSAFKNISTSVSKLDNSKINNLTANLNKLDKNTTKGSTSFTDFAAKIGITSASLYSLSRGISSLVKKSTEYIENINLFAVSMGDYADAALDYANQVQSIMGIDTSDWIRNQSIFMTLATGFGVASDEAYKMSKNLTQLGYDISSFFNLSLEDSMLKLQSGLSGELEPLRRIGYDLSVARLQQEAYNLGIEKSVSVMTQAEKAQLRYYAIMTQVTTVQGDMARTLEQPANQIRILTANINMAARAIGNIFIPALNAILPVAIAIVQVITDVANAIAALFGFEIVMPSYDTIEPAVSGTGEVADNLDDAAGSAKKLKNNLLGIDELNIISPDTGSGSGAGAGASGGGFDIELPEYDFLGDAISTRIDDIKKKLKEILPLLEAIGIALAAWKLSNMLQNLLDLQKLTFWQKLQTWAGLFVAIGGAIIYAQGALDALANGIDWSNLLKMLSGLAIAASGVYIALKPFTKNEKYKNIAYLGSWFTAAAGGAGIFAVSLLDVIKNGADLESFVGVVSGLAIASGSLYKASKKLKSPFAQLISPVSTLVGSIGILATGFYDMNVNGANLTNTLMVLVGIIGTVAGAIWTVNTALIALEAHPIIAAITGAIAICGALFGSVTALIGVTAAAGQEARNSSIEYQRWSASMEEANARIEESNSKLEDLDTAMDSVWDAMSETQVAKELANQIYDLSDKTNKSVSEVENLKFMIDTLNSMGLEGVQLEFDETTQKVITNRDEIFNAIDALQEYAMKEAVLSVAKDIWTTKIEAQMEYRSALDDLQTSMNELAALEEQMSSMSMYNEDGSLNSDYFGIYDKTTALRELMVTQREAVNSTKELVAESDKDLAQLNSLYAELPQYINGSLGQVTQAQQTFSDNSSVVMGEAGAKMQSALVSSFDAEGTSQQLIDTLSQGMTANSDQVATAAAGITNAIKFALTGVEAVTSAIGGGSPMYQAGYDMTSQAASGLTDGSEQVAVSAQDLGTTVTENATAEGGINADTATQYTQEYTGAINDTMTTETETLKTTTSSMASSINTEFTNVANYDVWYGYGSNLVSGLEAGINSKMDSILTKVRNFAREINQAFDSGNFDFGSPSKRYIERGEWMVEGFNIGMTNRMNDTYRLVEDWGQSISATSAKALATDTRNIGSMLPSSLSQSVYQSVDAHSNIREEGFDEALTSWYQNNIAPQMTQLVDNTQRQADKNESVTVQIGNQEVANAVKQQQRANGYSFIKG